MTDKVQKVREEVERLQNELIQEKEKGFGSDIDDACILELQNVLTYIDSLQEEPVSSICLQKDIVIVLNGQRHRQVLHKGCFSKKECKEKCSLYERCQRCCIDLCMFFFHDPHCHFEEEPVSKDLEKESKKYSSCIYLEEVLSDDDKEVLKGRLINTFKAGANWQKEQMEKEYSDLNKGLVFAKGVAVYMAYETGKKEVIAKACKYLQEHREEVETEDNGISGWISDEFIEKFKKAVKE